MKLCIFIQKYIILKGYKFIDVQMFKLQMIEV
jgi:hypothetical protein